MLKEELHLTKLAGVVQMRPQFHHIDAAQHIEQVNRRKELEAVEGIKRPEPRAVHMTMRSAEGENIDMNTTKQFLQRAKDDPWIKLRYLDEDVSSPRQSLFHWKMPTNLFVDRGSVRCLS
jgi:DNA-directed RNA polymerase III subunit RPC5